MSPVTVAVYEPLQGWNAEPKSASVLVRGAENRWALGGPVRWVRRRRR